MNIDQYISKYAVDYTKHRVRKSTKDRIMSGASTLGAPAALLTTILSSSRGLPLTHIGRGALIAGTAGTALGALATDKHKSIYTKVESAKDIASNMQGIKYMGK